MCWREPPQQTGPGRGGAQCGILAPLPALPHIGNPGRSQLDARIAERGDVADQPGVAADVHQGERSVEIDTLRLGERHDLDAGRLSWRKSGSGGGSR